MATGTVTGLNQDGSGVITPDSRGEPVHFTRQSYPDWVLIEDGQRVRYQAAVTHRGVIAGQMRPD